MTSSFFAVSDVSSLACYQSSSCLASVPPHHKEKWCTQESGKDIRQSPSMLAKSGTVGKQ